MCWVNCDKGANAILTNIFRHFSTFNGNICWTKRQQISIEKDKLSKVVFAIQLKHTSHISKLLSTWILSCTSSSSWLCIMIIKNILIIIVSSTWGEDGVEGDNLLLARFLIIERSESADEILFNFRWPV